MHFEKPGGVTMLCKGACAVIGGVILAAALAGPASAEPALWKIRGARSTVYLFGTVHVLKSTTTWRSPKIDAAFGASTALWEEVSNADDAAVVQPLFLQYGVDRAHPLSSLLDDGAKAKLAAFETAYGIGSADVEPLRPWLAALTLGNAPIAKAGFDPKIGPDIALKTLAAQQGKTLSGFETVQQQVHFFADLPQQTQVDYLLYNLDHAATAAGQVDAIIDAWTEGDTTRLQTLFNGGLLTRYPELYRVLVVDRNRAMAAKIEELVKGDGVSFVAVGVAHLVGPDSVPALLARDGIEAVRQ